MIGSKFAGRYSRNAAISNAQVRAMLCGIRACNRAAQRGQCISGIGSAARHNKPHERQDTKPRATALVAGGRCGSYMRVHLPPDVTWIKEMRGSRERQH